MPARENRWRLSRTRAADDPGEAAGGESVAGADAEVRPADPVDGAARDEAGDVRRLRARVRELERRNERLESVARALDHDLHGPLVVASHHLEFAREEPDGTHFDAIEDAHDRLEALVEELRAAAEGTATVDPEPVALAPLVGECWAGVGTAGADLVVDTDAVVAADRSRLSRLLENLFRNAVEHGSTSPRSNAHEDAVEHGSTSPRSDAHSQDGTGVTVTVGDLPDGFYVADDGPGIPAGEHELVFEEGYTTSDDGTGLGLAIVAGVAREHGWRVRLGESEAGGARFEVTDVETRPER